jgi:transcription antitermination factor NusG
MQHPRRWLVAYTAARCEERAAEALEAEGAAAFLPTREIRVAPSRHVRGKPRLVRKTIPLFTRYLFADAPVRTVLETDGVVDVLRLNGSPVTVSDGIVEQIRERVRLGAYDEATSIRLMAGDEVVLVSSGFLTGFTGRVVRQPKSPNRVELEVNGIEVVTRLDGVRKAC